MSIANYADLKTAVKNWMNDSNLDAYIPDFIRLAETKVYRDVRATGNQTTFTKTISSGSISIDNFIELDYVYILSNSKAYKLEVRPPDWIIEKFPVRSSDAMPRYIANIGGSPSTFIFGPYPDSGYTVTGGYFYYLSALSSTSTNWFITYAPDILLFATLLEAEPFIMNDDRIPMWQFKYDQAKDGLKKLYDRSKYGGGANRSHAA